MPSVPRSRASRSELSRRGGIVAGRDADAQKVDASSTPSPRRNANYKESQLYTSEEKKVTCALARARNWSICVMSMVVQYRWCGSVRCGQRISVASKGSSQAELRASARSARPAKPREGQHRIQEAAEDSGTPGGKKPTPWCLARAARRETTSQNTTDINNKEPKLRSPRRLPRHDSRLLRVRDATSRLAVARRRRRRGGGPSRSRRPAVPRRFRVIVMSRLQE